VALTGYGQESEERKSFAPLQLDGLPVKLDTRRAE
jgi:hypothetical protein